MLAQTLAVYVSLVIFYFALVSATPPACFLSCLSQVARACSSPSDVSCLCNSLDCLIPCFENRCPGSTFLSSRDHYWGTCKEHQYSVLASCPVPVNKLFRWHEYALQEAAAEEEAGEEVKTENGTITQLEEFTEEAISLEELTPEDITEIVDIALSETISDHTSPSETVSEDVTLSVKISEDASPTRNTQNTEFFHSAEFPVQPLSTSTIAPSTLTEALTATQRTSSGNVHKRRRNSPRRSKQEPSINVSPESPPFASSTNSPTVSSRSFLPAAEALHKKYRVNKLRSQ